MAFSLSPTTVAPSASLTASGTGTKKRPARIRVDPADPVMGNAILAEFTMAANGRFSRTITAPGGPDRETGLVLQQKRSDGVWAQTASVKLILATGGGGGTTPVPNPPPPPTPDITPPTVSGVSASVTTTTATIIATTNEAATVQVEFSTSGIWPGTLTAATSSGTSHSRTLTGLTPGQTYIYRIRATDTAGNLRLDGNRTFTTTAAATLPGAPTNLVATGGNTQVALAWTAPANNGGSAITGYRVYRNGASLIVLGVVLSYTNTGLTNGLTYTYTVAAITAVGEGPQSGSATATPAAAGDINPPIVSNVAIAAITTSGATITCNTNEASTVIVEYGTTIAYGSQTAATSSGTSHSRTLSGLSPSTLYHFRIRATDTAGNLKLDQDRTLTTASPAPPVITPTPSSEIVITASVTIADLSFSGPMPSGSAANLGIGIYANGPMGSPISTIVIRRCVFSGFSWAINLSNVTNYIIEDCVIADADYAGIAVYSGVTGQILRNQVRRIGYVRTDLSDPTFDNNAYGITLDRLGSGFVGGYPFSSGVLVNANLVEDVPLWHGLDTHAGRQITWTNNTVRRTPRAAFITGDSAGDFPHDNTFTGNRLEQAVSKAGGASKLGITYVGLQTGNLTGNFISSTYGTLIAEFLAESTNVTTSPNTTIA